MDRRDEESGIFRLSRARGVKVGYYDIKRNGEERNPNCPYFSLLGKVDTTLDRDENGEEVARICKCQMRNGVIL